MAIKPGFGYSAPDEKHNQSIINGNSLLLLCAFLLCLMSIPPIAQADESDRKKQPQSGFLYGAMINVRSEIYQDVDSSVSVFPVIGYRSEKLQVFGPFVSYSLSSPGEVDFRLQLRPRFAGYDASDSAVFTGMADRDNSLDFGFGLNYETDRWKIGLSSLHDILDRSGGTELSAKLSRKYSIGPIFIEPDLSLSYLDSNHVDYYYGVEASEATPNRAEYRGNSAINPSAGMSISTPIFFGGFTRFSIKNTWYDSSITDSPLVDKDSSLSVFISFTRHFGN